MLELLTNENVQLLIAIPIALRIFQKTEIYNAMKHALIQLYRLCVASFIFLKNQIQNDLSYLSASKRQQRPIKNANKIEGWATMIIFAFCCAWMFLFSSATLLLSTFQQEPHIFPICILFFTICIFIIRWFVACAYKAAWQNGINIKLKERLHLIQAAIAHRSDRY